MVVSVVVPVFNGADRLSDLYRRIAAALEGAQYELLLVNDGSGDASWERIVELAAADERVRGIDLTRNYGQHNALLAGIRRARYPVIVTLDDDLQNPPEEIPRLVRELERGHDVLYGVASSRQFGLLRNMATWLTKRALIVATGNEVAGSASAFRAFRTDLREAFADYQAPDVSIDVLLSWGTSSFGTVPVAHEPRAAGESAYSLVGLATHALNVLTGFSTRPLRVASLVGLGSTLFGLVILGFVVVRYAFQGNPVPGFPFLASVIAIFSGAQLLTLGVIGEYLARMHVRVMDRPSYVVRSETGQAGK